MERAHKDTDDMAELATAICRIYKPKMSSLDNSDNSQHRLSVSDRRRPFH